MANRFNDGVIDLSSLREKKEQEKKEQQQINFDAQVIMESIPQGYNATDDKGEPVLIEVVNAIVTLDKIFLIVTDNKEDEPNFLMIAGHKDNAILDGTLRQPTEEEFDEYQAIMSRFQQDFQDKANDAVADEDADTKQIIDDIGEERARELGLLQ